MHVPITSFLSSRPYQHFLTDKYIIHLKSIVYMYFQKLFQILFMLSSCPKKMFYYISTYICIYSFMSGNAFCIFNKKRRVY